MKKPKYYITTPIYYPNAKPHLGTLYSTLLADVAARWHQIMGYDVCFLTGTDEHGQKLQEKAEAEGKAPKAFVDAMIPAFTSVWSLYKINYSRFLRTTDQAHAMAVTEWIEQLKAQGDIYKSSYTGLYCVACESFITESEAAKDDAGRHTCPTHKRPLQEVAEESYFFRLSAFQDALLEFYEKHPDFVTPKERLQEVISFVKSGLKDLSLSRKTVSWGIPFPGDSNHTVYVWGDALQSYMSGVGYGQGTDMAKADFARWWPADVHVMAKDILRFHAVYWPAFLMAANLPLPKKLLVHGYVLMGDHKMSKSLGNVYEPEALAAKYGVEPIRYYLTRHIPISQDGKFDIEDLEKHVNADLANSLGNLLNRTVSLALSNGLTEVKAPAAWETPSLALREKCEEAFRICWEEMNKYNYHIALAGVWKFIAEVNAFVHAQQPWVLAKQNKELFAEVISAVCHSLRTIGILLWPVMPEKMEALLASIGVTFNATHSYEQELRENVWNRTFVLSKSEQTLFTKIELTPAVQAEAPAQTKSSDSNDIGIEDFAKVHLAAGTILLVEPVKGSDKLYRLEVDLGAIGKRQILSGVAQMVKAEDLLGKQGIFVVNLKPRKMMGLESHGMMLFADDGSGKLSPSTVSLPIGNGARVK